MSCAAIVGTNHLKYHLDGLERLVDVSVPVTNVRLLPIVASFGCDGIVGVRLARRIAIPKQQCPLVRLTVLVPTGPSFASSPNRTPL